MSTLSVTLMNAKSIAQLMMKSTINRWFVINVVKFSIVNTFCYCDPVMRNLGLVYKMASSHVESFSFIF